MHQNESITEEEEKLTITKTPSACMFWLAVLGLQEVNLKQAARQQVAR